MYVRTTSCPACSEDASTCTVRAMYPAQGTPPLRRCCTRCSHAERRVEVVARRVPPLPADDTPATPLTGVELDTVVEAVLARADDDGVEQAGRVSIGAYKSLARSRGLGLEEVVRAAYRDRLRDVVAIPPLHRSAT